MPQGQNLNLFFIRDPAWFDSLWITKAFGKCNFCDAVSKWGFWFPSLIAYELSSSLRNSYTIHKGWKGTVAQQQNTAFPVLSFETISPGNLMNPHEVNSIPNNIPVINKDHRPRLSPGPSGESMTLSLVKACLKDKSIQSLDGSNLS